MWVETLYRGEEDKNQEAKAGVWPSSCRPRVSRSRAQNGEVQGWLRSADGSRARCSRPDMRNSRYYGTPTEPPGTPQRSAFSAAEATAVRGS